MNRLLLAILLPLCLIAGPASAADGLRIAVTSSFQPTLQVLETRLETTLDMPVTLVSAATGTLYRQIDQGAPFDVFLAADGEHPLRLVRDGLALEDTLRPYARGQLVLAGGPPGRPPQLTAVLTPRQRIAIPNPLSAPYGQSAHDWLRRMKFWDEVRPRLVTANNVAQAAQMVETGNVDLAFTALPVARNLRRTAYRVIPARDYPPLLHVGVVIAGGSVEAGRRFLAELTGASLQDELLKQGYLPLPEPAATE